jgi:predicted hydrocarbon binding protein
VEPRHPVTDRASNPVLADLDDDRRGRLTYRGHRYLLIRPETLGALRRAMADIAGERVAEAFAAAGRAGGARASELLPAEREERVRALCVMGTALGWGLFTLEQLTASTMVVTVRDSPFADRSGSAAAPTCDLIRGVLDSVATAMIGPSVQVHETACTTMGAERCRFEGRARPAG